MKLFAFRAAIIFWLPIIFVIGVLGFVFLTIKGVAIAIWESVVDFISVNRWMFYYAYYGVVHKKISAVVLKHVTYKELFVLAAKYLLN